MKSFIYPAALTVMCVVLAITAVFFPFAFIPFVFAATLLFTLATAVSVSKTQMMITQGIIAASFLVALITTGSFFFALFFLILFYPVGASVGVSFLQKKNLNSTGATALIAASAMALAAALVYVFEATYPNLSLTAAFEPLSETLKTTVADYLTNGDQSLLYQPAVSNMVDTFYTLVLSYIPALIGVWLLLTTLFSYWLLRSVMRHLGRDVSHMGYFTDFRVSRAGAVVYCISTLVVLFAGNTAFGYVMLNFSSIMMLVYTYAGISIIGFFLELKNIGKTKRAIVYLVLILICLIPFGLSTLISFAGLADSWLDIRERVRNSGV